MGGRVVLIIEVRNAYKLQSDSLNGRVYLTDLSVDGRILLICITKKWSRIVLNGLLTGEGYEWANRVDAQASAPSGYIKGWDFVDGPIDFQFLKMDFASRIHLINVKPVQLMLFV